MRTLHTGGALYISSSINFVLTSARKENPLKNASLSGQTRGGWHCNKVLERCDYVMSNDNGDSPVNAQNVYHFEESLQLSGGGMLR